MRFRLLSLFFFLVILHAQSQSDHQVVIGTIDTLHSDILGEQRTIWVYTPGDRNGNVFAPQKYPVVYLLDGPGHFVSVVGMIDQLSTSNGNTLCPEMIVVGIQNTDRTRDLTPSPSSDEPFVNVSGGGEQFLKFMEKELMPYIESHYPTQPYRMLIGHSLGGLTAMYTLLHHPDLFNAYIAIDPSMWWDQRKLLKEADQILKEKDFTGKSLYLGIANTMPSDMSLKKLKKDKTDQTNHMRSIFDLSKTLDKYKKNGLHYQYKYYPEDNHGSVPLITEYDALRFIFNFYPLNLNRFEPNDTTMFIVHEIQKHYASLSEKMGFEILPSEMLINGLGYMCMQNENYVQAEHLFTLNIENYPESFNVYDSMGDCYVAKEDKVNAIRSYEKALSIRENEFSREKLEALKNN